MASDKSCWALVRTFCWHAFSCLTLMLSFWRMLDKSIDVAEADWKMEKWSYLEILFYLAVWNLRWIIKLLIFKKNQLIPFLIKLLSRKKRKIKFLTTTTKTTANATQAMNFILTIFSVSIRYQSLLENQTVLINFSTRPDLYIFLILFSSTQLFQLLINSFRTVCLPRRQFNWIWFD